MVSQQVQCWGKSSMACQQVKCQRPSLWHNKQLWLKSDFQLHFCLWKNSEHKNIFYSTFQTYRLRFLFKLIWKIFQVWDSGHKKWRQDKSDRVEPHEELPALVVGDVDEVEEWAWADGVGDVLQVGQSIQQPSLLRAHNQSVEVGIHDHWTQPLELCNQLKHCNQSSVYQKQRTSHFNWLCWRTQSLNPVPGILQSAETLQLFTYSQKQHASHFTWLRAHAHQKHITATFCKSCLHTRYGNKMFEISWNILIIQVHMRNNTLQQGTCIPQAKQHIHITTTFCKSCLQLKTKCSKSVEAFQ